MIERFLVVLMDFFPNKLSYEYVTVAKCTSDEKIPWRKCTSDEKICWRMRPMLKGDGGKKSVVNGSLMKKTIAKKLGGEWDSGECCNTIGFTINYNQLFNNIFRHSSNIV